MDGIFVLKRRSIHIRTNPCVVLGHVRPTCHHRGHSSYRLAIGYEIIARASSSECRARAGSVAPTIGGRRVSDGSLKNVNLALQGGGAHGAIVWGVLDRLLEDGRLGVEAISATSAGAMNAVALASGMAKGGPEEARGSLHEFWHK